MYKRVQLTAEINRLKRELGRDGRKRGRQITKGVTRQFQIEVARFIIKRKVILTGRLLNSFSRGKEGGIVCAQSGRFTCTLFTKVPYAKYPDRRRHYFKPLAEQFFRRSQTRLQLLIRRAEDRIRV